MSWDVDEQNPMALGEMTVSGLLDWATGRHARSTALIVGEVELTYAELHECADRLAVALRELGVGAGDRVAVLLPNCAEWVISYFAIARLDAVVVPVHSRYSVDEAAHVLYRSGATTLIGTEDHPLLPVIRAAPETAPRLGRIIVVRPSSAGFHAFEDLVAGAAPVASELASAATPADLFLINYTSGSTAAPKGVMLGHGQVVRNAYNVGARLRLQEGERFLSAMPFYHAGGSVLTILTALGHGCSIVTVERYNAGDVLDALERHDCSVHIGMDIMFLKEADHPSFSPRHVERLRAGWITATPEMALRAFERMPFPFCNLFGMTELSGNTCMTSLDDLDEVRLTWAGEPQPGIEVGIFDPRSGSRLGPGEEGEIRIRGWSVTRGYDADPDATAAAIGADGWFRTGDLGVLADTGYLRFSGRSKDMVKVGGENVSLQELETCIYAHAEVRMAHVVGMPHPLYGEVPVAFVETRPGAACTEEDLVAHCSRRLARFKVPRHVRLMVESEWPMTGPEKVNKAGLKALALNEFAG